MIQDKETVVICNKIIELVTSGVTVIPNNFYWVVGEILVTEQARNADQIVSVGNCGGRKTMSAGMSPIARK